MLLISSDEDKTKPAHRLAVCDMSRCYCSLKPGRVPLKRIQTAIGACAIRRTAQNKSSLHLFNLTTSQSG